MCKPLVSIIIPCYNHEHYIQDCIQSVIDQSYLNIELIIIDDGSSDNSCLKIQEMISSCEERFVRFEFRKRSNKGLSATLNEAIIWTEGKYFAALASDDQILSNKIDIQVRFMEKTPDVVALFAGANYIDENNKTIKSNNLEEKEYIFEKIFLNECQFYAPTQLMKTETLKNTGGYREDILVEDWYMWLKMAERGKIYCLSENLANYRIHSENTTKKSKFIYEHNLKTLSIYTTHRFYKQAYAKLRWTYIIWTGQQDKKESMRLLFQYLLEYPNQLLSKNFLRFVKYFFVKMNDWF